MLIHPQELQRGGGGLSPVLGVLLALASSLSAAIYKVTFDRRHAESNPRGPSPQAQPYPEPLPEPTSPTPTVP